MKTTTQQRRKQIVLLAVLYAFMSGLWIFCSDLLISVIFSDSIEKLKEFSLVKGLFFVFSTSWLFYMFCRKWQRYLEEVETNLEENAQKVVIGKTVQSNIFEVANEALFVIDKATYAFLEVNDAACSMYGYSKHDFLHSSLNALDLTNQPEKAESIFTNEVIRVEYGQHKKSNGKVFPVDITLTYFTLDDRRLVAVSVRDMTMHYELIQSLKVSEQKYIDAQLMANIGNWTWDIPSQNVTWSPGLYKISGIHPSQLPTSEADFYSIIHPEDRSLVSEKLNDLFTMKQPVVWESRMIDQAGKIRYVFNQCVLKTNSAGEPFELVGTIADITERKMAENEILKLNLQLEERVNQRTQQLVEINHDKDEILSIAAHDLRNPLGGILPEFK